MWLPWQYSIWLAVAFAVATHSATSRSFVKDLDTSGVADSLTKRDAPFGDYRTTEAPDP